MFIYYRKEKKLNNTMFLSKFLIHLCIIIHYIVEEKNIFVLIANRLLAKKIFKCHVKDCFKINGKPMIKMPSKGECVKFKYCKRKNEITIYDLCRF